MLLKSLSVLNQQFRGIVCFQGLDGLFVSRFSRHVTFPRPSSVKRREFDLLSKK
jgi:hypothetical protein